ncbi:hypothetical protein ACIBG6_19145 [Streptomyces sp. NPDC050842]|uniref:hypothetical protein n=1 Tax=Streptomyces sp. NPDC050842 TaxID=3365636 RepID=UPI0037A8E01A
MYSAVAGADDASGTMLVTVGLLAVAAGSAAVAVRTVGGGGRGGWLLRVWAGCVLVAAAFRPTRRAGLRDRVQLVITAYEHGLVTTTRTRTDGR